MADEIETMDEGEPVEGEEVSSDQLQGQTLFIPKTGDYQVPDSGSARIEFRKQEENEEGCFVEVTSFESEEAETGNEPTPDMDTEDHMNSFIEKRRGANYGSV